MKYITADDVSFDGIASIIHNMIADTNNRQTWISLRVNASASAPKVEPFFGASFAITINCSSTAYGWGWLQSDNAQNHVYYGRLSDGNWTWYKVGKQDDIDALNSSGRIAGHDWLTEKGGKNDSNANLTLEYRGKVAHITIHSANDTFEENELLFSVPDGYRSNSNCDVLYYINSETGVLRFDTNGDAKIWLPTNTKGRIYADFTYMLK